MNAYLTFIFVFAALALTFAWIGYPWLAFFILILMASADAKDIKS